MEKVAFGKFWLVFVQWVEVEAHHLLLFIYISDPQCCRMFVSLIRAEFISTHEFIAM